MTHFGRRRRRSLARNICNRFKNRLSTVMNAQNIAVMDKGMCIEQGTHDSLMRDGGVYSSLVARQVNSINVPAADTYISSVTTGSTDGANMRK